MSLNARRYSKILNDDNISVIYNGPIWADGIDGLAEMLLKRLKYEDAPFTASQAVFSVFVEQMNNMMMYSAERETPNASNGIFILGVKNIMYFIQTGNAVTPNSAAILKERIDYLNSLNKKELRQYYMKCAKGTNDNPESKGAGLGLIEIARRASSPISYEFEQMDDGLLYFTMYITVAEKSEKGND